jgi:hypothetical protein
MAATVLLCRARPNARVEVLVVVRSPNTQFMSGFHAFPGGRHDAADGPLGETLAATLETIAAERAGGKRKALVFATHHPPYSSAGHGGSSDVPRTQCGFSCPMLNALLGRPFEPTRRRHLGRAQAGARASARTRASVARTHGLTW